MSSDQLSLPLWCIVRVINAPVWLQPRLYTADRSRLYSSVIEIESPSSFSKIITIYHERLQMCCNVNANNITQIKWQIFRISTQLHQWFKKKKHLFFSTNVVQYNNRVGTLNIVLNIYHIDKEIYGYQLCLYFIDHCIQSTTYNAAKHTLLTNQSMCMSWWSYKRVRSCDCIISSEVRPLPEKNIDVFSMALNWIRR